MRWRIVAVLYWIAVGMLAVGAVVLVVADDDDALLKLGEVIVCLALPAAATGALLDTLRHQRGQGRVAGAGEHGGDGSTPRLRSDA